MTMPPRIPAGRLSFAPPRWACPKCDNFQTRSQRRQLSYERTFTKTQRSAYRSRLRRPGVLIAAAGGAVGASVLFFVDDAKYAFKAADRSLRVAKTLFANISDYRRTLEYKLDDPEAHARELKACHKRCAERTLRTCEHNGSVFIKLGQHLSSMGYLLPTEWVETFVPLQDKCPVSSYESIEDMFLKDTGMHIADMFETFEETPIGSASLAQVHKATMKGTGQPVAVKVQHPDLEQWIPIDMGLTRFTFRTLARFFPEYDLTWLSSEMDFSLPKELDFREEARNATRAREYFANISSKTHPVVIPEVKFGLKRILAMEYVSGHRPDDLAYIDSHDIDRDEVSAALARIFNEMIFGDNAPLHCDPHGGNIAIRRTESGRRKPNFDVVLYDHGLYRDIPIDIKRNYAHLWLAVIDNNEDDMRKYAKAVAGITDHQFPLFASAITGRDYTALRKSSTGARGAEEKQNMGTALTEGMLSDLVQLLGQVPRIMLLILKTNDLTRSLDEGLRTREGPARTFLILAKACSKTVFGEQRERIRERGSLFWPSNFLGLLVAWARYMRVELKLSLYETYLSSRRRLGLKPIQVQSPGAALTQQSGGDVDVEETTA